MNNQEGSDHCQFGSIPRGGCHMCQENKMTFTPVTIVPPCPPHDWGHAPTVNYYRCAKCRKQVNHDEPGYAAIMVEHQAHLADVPPPPTDRKTRLLERCLESLPECYATLRADIEAALAVEAGRIEFAANANVRTALENLVGALGRRDPFNDSALLPPEQQMGEIGDAMRALAGIKEQGR